MATKDSGKVTITLDRTTVAQLREEKGGMAWDAFMLDLIESRKPGVRARCVLCRKIFRSTDIDLSPSILAQRLGWKEVSVRGRPDSIGFLCKECRSEMEKKGEIIDE